MSDKKEFTIRRNTAAMDAKRAEKEKKSEPEPKSNDRRRKPLNEKEREFMKDFYYKKSGMPGRDILFRQIQRHYEKNNTPQSERISRRRMAAWLFSQETNQLHRGARKNSLITRPIVAMDKFTKCQADLIVRGQGESAAKYKAILAVIDVATRKAWTELLTSKTSKATAAAFTKILDRAYDELPQKDKDRLKGKKTKFWSIVATDNGPEFKSEFSTFLKSKGIRQVFGVSNKSTGQSLIERFNQSLQSGMERERTATGKRWYELSAKHTELYNTKPGRMMRLKQENGKYKHYAPDDLWDDADTDTLTRLYNDKKDDLSMQGKGGKEESIAAEDTVRLVLFGKRKDAMAKGFRQSWSKELYVVTKVKRPPGYPDTQKPTKYFVKNKETDKMQKDANGRPIPYTINDLQKIEGGTVEKAPDDMVAHETVGTTTRSGKTAPVPTTPTSTPPSTPKAKARPAPKEKPPKAPPKPKVDPLIGASVQSWIDVQKGKKTKEVRITGTIKRKQRRGAKGWYYQVEWDHDGQYKDTEWFKQSDVKKIIISSEEEAK